MEFRETPWEYRSLKVASCEFHIDNQDSFDSKIIDKYGNYGYQAIRISMGNVGALIAAQDYGFRFIETSILFELDPRKEHHGIYDRFRKYISYQIASEKETEEVFKIIRSGRMFLTDKIALDPAFGTTYSGKRYEYWIRDVLNTGSNMYLVLYKGEAVGVQIPLFREDGNTAGVVGGVFPEHEKKGLGFSPLMVLVDIAKERKSKRLFSGVSTNNLPVYKLHEQMGFSVKEMTYLLVRHI